MDRIPFFIPADDGSAHGPIKTVRGHVTGRLGGATGMSFIGSCPGEAVVALSVAPAPYRSPQSRPVLDLAAS